MRWLNRTGIAGTEPINKLIDIFPLGFRNIDQREIADRPRRPTGNRRTAGAGWTTGIAGRTGPHGTARDNRAWKTLSVGPRSE